MLYINIYIQIMRYIREYSKFESDEKFHEISLREFDELAGGVWIDKNFFTKNDLNALDEVLSLRYLTFDPSDTWFLNFKITPLKYIGIWKAKDDWFYLYYRCDETHLRHYYKCDQIDGVIDCIKSLDIHLI